MKKYMFISTALQDGHYKTNGKLRWHERIRLRLAYWLFKSVPAPYDSEVKTTTGIM